MRLVAFSIATSLLLVACASQPQRATPDDRAAFEEIENRHAECLGQKSAEFMRGSDDVALLTKHVMSLCEPVLSELNQEIIRRGFSPAYARGYVTAAREEAEQITRSGILKIKSGDAP